MRWGLQECSSCSAACMSGALSKRKEGQAAVGVLAGWWKLTQPSRAADKGGQDAKSSLVRDPIAGCC